MMKKDTDSLRIVRAIVTILVLCSMAGFVLTAVFGFEEPNPPLLVLSAGLLVGAILAVLAHLSLTSELDRSQKRVWLRHLTGRNAMRAWTEYLSCDDLRTATIRFGEAGPKGR